MSRKIVTLLLLIALAVCCGCGSNGSPLDLRAISVIPTNGSSLNGIDWQTEDGVVSLQFSRLPATGTFLHIDVPDGIGFATENWINGDQTLHLAVNTRKGIELGIMPLPGHSGPVSVALSLKQVGKTTSVPPIGLSNRIRDLMVREIDTEHVELSWTESNVGDYDCNGAVGIADITPLGMYFGQPVDRNDPLIKEKQQYWVDGDGNGLLNISDLTPIGVNFNSFVYGFNVVRNGATIEALGGGYPTVLRQNYARPKLPARVVLEVPGSADDIWNVVPVDGDLVEGTGSDSVTIDRLDLRVSALVEGIQVLDPLPGNGPIVLRVIDPGDIVNRFPLVPMIPGPDGVQFFNNLPRGRELLLDVMYVPEFSLATGLPNISELAEITSIPFKLSPGGQQLDLNAVLSITPSGAGYSVSPAVTKSEVGNVETQAWIFDVPAGLVASDTNSNGNLADEAQLVDSDLDGVSNARWQFQIDYNTYKVDDQGQIQDVLLLGKIATFDEAQGKLRFDTSSDADWPRDITDLTPDKPQGVPLPGNPPLFVYFTELTAFIDMRSGEPVSFDPSTIAPGDKLWFKGVRLTSPNILGEKFWVSEIRVVPADYVP